MIGRVISGRYVVEAVVGTGGMAVVYRAYDKIKKQTDISLDGQKRFTEIYAGYSRGSLAYARAERCYAVDCFGCLSTHKNESKFNVWRDWISRINISNFLVDNATCLRIYFR